MTVGGRTIGNKVTAARAVFVHGTFADIEAGGFQIALTNGAGATGLSNPVTFDIKAAPIGGTWIRDGSGADITAIIATDFRRLFGRLIADAFHHGFAVEAITGGASGGITTSLIIIVFVLVIFILAPVIATTV